MVFNSFPFQFLHLYFLQVVGTGGFFGLRNLVQAAKSAAGAGHHLAVPSNETSTSPLPPNGGLTNATSPTADGLFPLMGMEGQQQIRAPSPSSVCLLTFYLF